jgi:hypothetical protein
MAIPNARAASPPPPLPPPRYINELKNGQDPGWQWGNSPNSPEYRANYRSIKSGSSLLGNYTKEPTHRFKHEKDQPDYVFGRRESIPSVSSLMSYEMDRESAEKDGRNIPSLSDHRYVTMLSVFLTDLYVAVSRHSESVPLRICPLPSKWFFPPPFISFLVFYF